MKKVQGSSRFPLIPHQLCFVCEGKFYLQKSDQLFKQRFDIIETQTQETSDEIWVLEVEIKVLEEQITKQTIDEWILKDRMKDKCDKKHLKIVTLHDEFEKTRKENNVIAE